MEDVAWIEKVERDGRENLEKVRAQVLKRLQGARKIKRKGSKGNDRGGGAAAGESIKKSRGARVIERKKVRGDDPIECFFLMKVKSIS